MISDIRFGLALVTLFVCGVATGWIGHAMVSWIAP